MMSTTWRNELNEFCFSSFDLNMVRTHPAGDLFNAIVEVAAE